MEDGIIYTFGDIDALVVIFDGLRMLFDPAVTTFFSVTGGLGLGVASTVAAMIALIGTMNQYISQQQLQMQGPLVGLFIYALVAIPTVDRMYVSDINTGKTLPIYDVPIGLGVVGYGMIWCGGSFSEAFWGPRIQLRTASAFMRLRCSLAQ